MSHNQFDKKSEAWSALFSEPMSDLVKRYTSSVFFDKRLWQADIAGSLAHADMLAARVKTQGEYKVALMHGDIAQKDRSKALAGFRTGEFDVIIATDVAARGLDVTGVTHVINYSVPDSPEDYVHRIGRTGRAEKEGDAFTILSADELPAAQAVERLIGQTVERRRLPDFEYQYTTMLDDSKGAQKALAENLGRGRLRVGKRRR